MLRERRKKGEGEEGRKGRQVREGMRCYGETRTGKRGPQNTCQEDLEQQETRTAQETANMTSTRLTDR